MQGSAITAAVAVLAGGALAGEVIGQLEYLSEADSPYAGVDGWVLENFEDGLLNIPGVSIDTGVVIGPGGATDSVGGDDRMIDGSGTNGRSLFSASGATGVTFTFDAGEIGGAPVSAGIVWTDGSGAITFRAFDTMGVLIGEITAAHADGTFVGTTAEDRFYGVNHAAGIGSIFISNAGGGIELDHLQYVIPAPGSAAALAGAGLIMLRRRRA